MKKRLLALALAATALLLSACARETSGRTVIEVYRVVAPYYRTSGELLRAEETPASPGLEILGTAVAAFNAQPSDPELDSPMPYGARISGWELRGTVLYLEVNRAYAELSGLDAAILNCCAVLTFCSVDGVDKVAVRCGDETVSAPVSASEIITSDALSQA